ncbi:LysR family transcriptional regulator, partial [Klebsiella pneumoniae]|nr:LysR family transcriptional regulator [Klebsiella pneumoniae]
LQHLDQRLFKVARLPQTRMGLLHDKRHFDFSGATPGWEALATLPLGFLTKGMYYRESIEISFKAKGLTPKYVF